MADSFITQVERPAENPRPARKPKLKLELDSNGNPIPEQPTSPSADGDGKADVDNRNVGLGKIFSRQFTPTVPKSTFFQDKENRTVAQSPRNVAQSPKGTGSGSGAGLETHNEDEEEKQRSSADNTAPSSADAQAHSNGASGLNPSARPEVQPKASLAGSDGPASPSAPPAGFNSPRGAPKAADFPAPAPPAARAHLAPEPYVSDDPDALLTPNLTGKKMCLVLDLDETLVHSSFKPVPHSDFILNIEMDGITHKVYVLKRPGVDEFLVRMAEFYELVIFTASLDKYANPLLDLLDTHKTITGRLYREHCTRQGQTYVKDLGRLGRKVNHTLIIDNSPYSYAMHLNNAVPILSWFDDPHDTELLDMMPFLENLTKLEDVAQVLDANKPWRVTNKKLMKILSETSDNASSE
eukprot:TRINITY_DN1719_c0_g1_i4.p1 TRINITY_DN1719_c0_g1~~TRINITY_DN1719_c0_g1_i4.p1  ORF type:complete len:410 (+),score=107.65 TRINITY_DN1719_c0_g1_i4:901-2130(+)